MFKYVYSKTHVQVFLAVLTKQEADAIEHAFFVQLVAVADLSQIPARRDGIKAKMNNDELGKN